MSREMKIFAENGVYLGVVFWENGVFFFEPTSKMTTYMLEETLKKMKRLEGGKK